jgi:hypothetical protein
MSRKNKPLVQFNADYYKYPTSVSRGYWGRYPTDRELSEIDKEQRQAWIDEINMQVSSGFHKTNRENFFVPSDINLMHSLLHKHGVFVERFFKKEIHERIARMVAKTQLDLNEFQRMFALISDYEYRLTNQSEIIYQIKDHIFEHLLVDGIQKFDIQQKLNSWFDKFCNSRTCILCNSEFRVIDLPDWIYFGSNGFNTCCFQCPILESPKKSELIKLIPEFVDACGFIPTSDADLITYSFTCRLLDTQYKDVFLAYAKMGGIDHVKKKFGTWFKALAETRTLPNGVLATARGIRCLAKDGHVCHSLDEQRIDNWFSAKGIPHEREPQYPKHPELNPIGGRRADWRVQDIFIEYFGLIGDPNYEKKMNEKILLAELSSINLIAIYPSDIGNLDNYLKSLLEL